MHLQDALEPPSPPHKEQPPYTVSSSRFLVDARRIYTDASSSSTLTRCHNSPMAPSKKLCSMCFLWVPSDIQNMHLWVGHKCVPYPVAWISTQGLWEGLRFMIWIAALQEETEKLAQFPK